MSETIVRVPPAAAVEELVAAGSVQGVRGLLLRAGCRGTRFLPEACPVASYLTLRTGHEWSISPTTAIGRGAGKWSLPAHVTEFVRAFDRYEMPELIK